MKETCNTFRVTLTNAAIYICIYFFISRTVIKDDSGIWTLRIWIHNFWNKIINPKMVQILNICK